MQNKIVFISGARSGIGEARAEERRVGKGW